MPEVKRIRDLKPGDLFTLRPIAEPRMNQVFVRGEFDRHMRKYEAEKYDDICEWKYLPGDREVYVGFTF